MEWLGVLLLYLISGIIKKRDQNKRRKKIESDPDWDSKNDKSPKDQQNSLNQILNNLFDSEELLTDFSGAKKESTNDTEKIQVELENNKNSGQKIIESPTDTISSDIEQKNISFEDKIYHSELSEKHEQHLGNKWNKKINIRAKLFNSRKSIRKSIIIKEILDEPLALRK